eukprot:scaffold208_cov63-Attheya_sp.AAC.8
MFYMVVHYDGDQEEFPASITKGYSRFQRIQKEQHLMGGAADGHRDSNFLNSAITSTNISRGFVFYSCI